MPVCAGETSFHVAPASVEYCHLREVDSPPAPVQIPSLAWSVSGVPAVGEITVSTVGSTCSVVVVSPYVTVWLVAVMVIGLRLTVTLPAVYEMS